MGQVSFLVPRHEHLSKVTDGRAYLTGIDGIPWQNRIEWTNDSLVVTRAVSDSGNFHFAWPVKGYGEVSLSTGCLMERKKPYVLQVELARGTISRIRNQLADWQATGLTVPQAIADRLSQAFQFFLSAITTQNDVEQAAEYAEQAIEIAMKIANAIGVGYAERVLAARHRQTTRLPTLFGANLGDTPLDEKTAEIFLRTFNTACVPFTWSQIDAKQGHYDWSVCDKQIQWCHDNSLKVCGGPLLQMSQYALPDWLFLWEGDFENITLLIKDFVEAVVSRYQDQVDVWLCAGRVNIGDELALSEEQKLALAVRTIEVIKACDSQTPVVICFDQPWAEYMSHHGLELSPLHFADALVRGELGLTGLGLEINLGYFPGGTLFRDTLEFSTQIDRWTYLGLPLLIMLAMPSSNQPDPKARCKAQPVDCSVPGGLTPEVQKHWIEQYVPLVLSKIPVQIILWNQLSDAVPNDFAHGGLFDAKGQPKPALGALEKIRCEHLT